MLVNRMLLYVNINRWLSYWGKKKRKERKEYQGFKVNCVNLQIYVY